MRPLHESLKSGTNISDINQDNSRNSDYRFINKDKLKSKSIVMEVDKDITDVSKNHTMHFNFPLDTSVDPSILKDSNQDNMDTNSNSPTTTKEFKYTKKSYQENIPEPNPTIMEPSFSSHFKRNNLETDQCAMSNDNKHFSEENKWDILKMFGKMTVYENMLKKSEENYILKSKSVDIAETSKQNASNNVVNTIKRNRRKSKPRHLNTLQLETFSDKNINQPLINKTTQNYVPLLNNVVNVANSFDAIDSQKTNNYYNFLYNLSKYKKTLKDNNVDVSKYTYKLSQLSESNPLFSRIINQSLDKSHIDNTDKLHTVSQQLASSYPSYDLPLNSMYPNAQLQIKSKSYHQLPYFGFRCLWPCCNVIQASVNQIKKHINEVHLRHNPTLSKKTEDLCYTPIPKEVLNLNIYEDSKGLANSLPIQPINYNFDHDYQKKRSIQQNLSFNLNNENLNRTEMNIKNMKNMCKPKNTQRPFRKRSDIKKCRKVYGMDKRDLWCTQCKWKKACSRFVELKKQISLIKWKSGINNEFTESLKKLDLLKNVTNSEKLKLYGLYKQATIGKCNTSKPSLTDLIGKAKWAAWNKCAKFTKTEAEKEYTLLVEKIYNKSNLMNMVNDGFISTLINNGTLEIKLNNEKKLNCLSKHTYLGITQILNQVKDDPKIKSVALTGQGNYFSSGNDVTSIAQEIVQNEGNNENMIIYFTTVVKNFVKSIIDFSKPLVALINGPAIGISVTILPLFDYVLASEQATFQTPFTNMGLCPEGCSTLTFFNLMGLSKATEILLFEKTLTAQEAFNVNLVNKFVPLSEFENESKLILEKINKFNVETLRKNKKMMRFFHLEKLHSHNEIEMNAVKDRLKSKESKEAAQKFLKNFVFFLGVYVGVYIDQNYSLPKVGDPKSLYKGAIRIMDNYKKDDSKDDK
ncbi:D3,D2-enoyl-CoA isomerase [Intoshia linei]|uniref:D3,D2-enoyl-CoA isomerase n=1 Tax=Intoshia linei TaxID=1819745 RepID=A0A177B1C5_9BILA|nr:D3,D2-enoyl-CoA isomerase [Intoshia linei]